MPAGKGRLLAGIAGGECDASRRAPENSCWEGRREGDCGIWREGFHERSRQDRAKSVPKHVCSRAVVSESRTEAVCPVSPQAFRGCGRLAGKSAWWPACRKEKAMIQKNNKAGPKIYLLRP
jgi:hypothetical protein